MKKAVLLRLFIGITFLAGQWAIAQIPEVTGLSLSATSNSTDANLIATYTTTGPIVDTATAWYKDLDPVALLYLPFEAGSTNALLDFSGSDNDASYSVNVLERPTWATAMGHNGSGAFFFDGGDHLDVGGILPLSSSYTKTAWINIATDANGFRNIMSSVLNDANNHHFKIDPNGRLNAGHNLGESIVEDSDSINHDQWYFVAVTFDFNSGEMTLYRDGNEVDRAIVPEEFRAVADANVIIGAKNYGFEWQGYIDEPRLYGHVLSADQIETMYEGNDLIEPQETRGEEDWYCVVTPFSVSDVGTPVQSNTVTLQGPEITGLSLSSTSGDNLTTDDLTASYTPNARVRETASAWYRNGTPVNTLYLPFEADYPNVLQDFSGSENHVTRSMDQDSVPAWYPYVHNGIGALEFTGNDYLLAVDALPLSASYTKTAWVYAYSSGFNNIMSSSIFAANNHTFKLNPDMSLNAGHSNGDAIVSSDETNVYLSTGQWHFVAVSFDYESGEMAVFVDGAEADRQTVPAELMDVTDPSVLVGSLSKGFGFTGMIDEPRVFNYALSPEQISTLEADGNDIIRSEETEGSDEWYVDVTPFSTYEIGTTVSSDPLTIVGQVVTDIPDQSIMESESFTTINLDDHVDDYSYTDAEQVWTSSGSSELVVTIDPDTRVANVAIPHVNWYGSETITFTVTNPNAESNDIEVIFTVENVNDAPELAVTGDQSTDEDVTLNLPVDFTDPDPTDAHSITVVSDEANVSVENISGDISGSTYDLVPADDWSGTAQITVTVTDDGTGALNDTETFTLTVNPVNDEPVIEEIGPQSVDEDNALTGLAVNFTDVDPTDAHTITVVSDEANVSVENQSGDVSGSTYDLLPADDWSGTAQITVTVTDNGTGALFDSEEYTFTVNAINDDPVLTEVGDQLTDEDITLNLSVDFTDPDPTDAHTITVVSDEANVSVENESGHVSGSTYDLVPAEEWSGTAQITVTVTDNGTGALNDTETFTLTVNSANDEPVIAEIGPQSVDEDNALTGLAVNFTDADPSDLHTISIVSDEANVSVENQSGDVSGSTYDLLPADDWSGTAQITVTVTDNGAGALSDSEVYAFTVNAINDDPVLTEVGDQLTDEDITLNLSVDFTDPDPTDAHTITVVSDEANVSVENISGDVSGSTYDLVPAAEWSGTAQITVTVTDNGTGALNDSETFTLTVNSVNDAPVIAEIGPQSVDEDNALTGLVVNFTDAEPSDLHTIAIVSDEANVSVENQSGNVSGSTYDLVPAADWAGTAQITVTVTDNGTGASFDSETYTLTVHNINDDPTEISISENSVDERVDQGTVVGLFTTADVDTEDNHVYSLVSDGGISDVDNDAFLIDGDALKTNADFDFEVKSSYSIYVESDDGNGGVIGQAFTISINDVDETSVEDIYNNPGFKVYPNPAVDMLTVEVDNPDNAELSFEIFSATGRLVLAEPIFSKKRIDLTGFQDGVYIVKIRGEQIYGTRKIIVKDR